MDLIPEYIKCLPNSGQKLIIGANYMDTGFYLGSTRRYGMQKYPNNDLGKNLFDFDHIFNIKCLEHNLFYNPTPRSRIVYLDGDRTSITLEELKAAQEQALMEYPWELETPYKLPLKFRFTPAFPGLTETTGPINLMNDKCYIICYSPDYRYAAIYLNLFEKYTYCYTFEILSDETRTVHFSYNVIYDPVDYDEELVRYSGFHIVYYKCGITFMPNVTFGFPFHANFYHAKNNMQLFSVPVGDYR